MSVIRLRNYKTSSSGLYDPDAKKFIDAVSVHASLTTAQKEAVNDLVKNLKLNGLWAKGYAIYPFIGGNAAAHKYNLKDPRDLDEAYRLSNLDTASFAHDSNGVTPFQGSSNSFFPPSNAGQNSLAMWFYSRGNVAETKTIMGVGGNSGPICLLSPRFSNAAGNNYDSINHYPGGTASAANTTGLLGVNRIVSTEIKSFRNGVSYVTVAAASGTPLTAPIFVFARNNPSDGQTTALASSFVAITQGFTDTEASNFYNNIQSFQTSLNRQL